MQRSCLCRDVSLESGGDLLDHQRDGRQVEQLAELANAHRRHAGICIAGPCGHREHIGAARQCLGYRSRAACDMHDPAIACETNRSIESAGQIISDYQNPRLLT